MPTPGDPRPSDPGHDPADPQPDGPPAPGEHDSAYELLQRGRLLLRGRHDAQAAVVLERAAALEPRKGSILEPLGRAYAQSGQLDRAIETFTALVEVDPASAYAHYVLGRVLRRADRPEEARAHLKLAIALDPGSALYRGELGRLPPEQDRPSGPGATATDDGRPT